MLRSMNTMFRSFFGTVAFKFFGQGFSLLLGVLLARALGPDNFGKYSYIMSIVAVATIPTVAGLPQLIIREVSKNLSIGSLGEIRGVLIWANLYVAIVSLIVIFLFFGLINFDFFDDSIKSLLVIALFLIPLKGMLAKQSSVINAFQRPTLAQIPTCVVYPLIFFIMASAYCMFGSQLTIDVVIFSQLISLFIATLFSVFVSQLIFRENVISSAIPALYSFMTWHKALLPFSLMFIISSLNAELATFFLGFLSTDENVAYFKVASQGIILISLNLQAINSIISPQIASSFSNNEFSVTQEVLVKSVRLSVICGVPISIGLYFFGGYIISFVFGDRYIDAASVLKVLCIGQVVNLCCGSVGVVLNMTGNELSTVKALIVSIILSIALLFLLVPIYGALGAAWSVTISLSVWNLIMAFEVKRLTGLRTWIS
ncbi:Flippase [Vibrio chagasii]|nr:Flippase [Vibrio chagasii]CAH7484446.1 Flippase [Vibrio chagasii]